MIYRKALNNCRVRCCLNEKFALRDRNSIKKIYQWRDRSYGAIAVTGYYRSNVQRSERKIELPNIDEPASLIRKSFTCNEHSPFTTLRLFYQTFYLQRNFPRPILVAFRPIASKLLTYRAIGGTWLMYCSLNNTAVRINITKPSPKSIPRFEIIPD